MTAVMDGETAYDAARLKTMDTLAKQYARLLDVRVTVLDPSGLVLAESAALASGMENHLDRPEIRQALNNQPGSEIRYSNTLQTQMLYTAEPVIKDGRVVGAVRLSVSLRAIRRSEMTMLNTILTTAAAAGLLTIILGIGVSYYTIYPLQKLSETAQRVASGQTDEITTTTRVDEIGQLHQSIQQMASHLKAQITDLRAERSKLQAVLAHMTDGVIIVDSEGIVQMANEAALRMFEVKEEEAVNHTLIEVARHHQIVELWRRRLITGEQQSVTLETSPARLFVQGIATPMSTTLPDMTLMVFQDLTHVRRLETVRRDFVSNVSHELRTPLASLKALTETLQEGALEDPPAARRFLQRMETEIDNLTQMVHELLELSRIESNKVPLKLTSVSPCEVAGPAVERMMLQAERAGLHLHMDCPADLPNVQADAQRIQQVLVNLIHNAIKFNQPGGEISISASRDGDFVVFGIRDTGVGIDPEVLPRIFERFYKVDRARSSGGTGLGLSIARHIVEAHSGRIWAESQVSRGSVFFFSLPIARGN
jgi:two-component system phosphate regulon sensor histidine kinase PhoR